MTIVVEPQQPVVLEIEGAPPLPARLESVSRELVSVSLPARPLTRGPLAGRPATIELATTRGIYRMSGPVQAEPGPDGIVTVARTHDAQLEQRREDVRVDAVRRVEVHCAALPGGRAITHTLNLSGTGMLIAGMSRLSEGDRVRFTIDLGDHHPTAEGEGVVLRVEDDGPRAVRFELIGRRHREAIVHFVFERQRVERRMWSDE